MTCFIFNGIPALVILAAGWACGSSWRRWRLRRTFERLTDQYLTMRLYALDGQQEPRP